MKSTLVALFVAAAIVGALAEYEAAKVEEKSREDLKSLGGAYGYGGYGLGYNGAYGGYGGAYGAGAYGGYGHGFGHGFGHGYGAGYGYGNGYGYGYPYGYDSYNYGRYGGLGHLGY